MVFLAIRFSDVAIINIIRMGFALSVIAQSLILSHSLQASQVYHQ